jgi:O-antigen ligase
MNDTNFAQNHPAKPLEGIVHGLIYLYILTIPFQALRFRLIGLSIGIPEIVFIILAPLAIIHIIRSDQKLLFDRLDLFVLGWLIATIISAWHTGFDSIIVTEIIKKVYLFFLYMILKWTIKPEIIERMIKVIILSSLIAALTGIIGYGLGHLGIDTTLSIIRPFPYSIENVTQAKGFTPTPNMLASIIMIGIFFQIHKIYNNRKLYTSNILLFVTLMIGFLVTFSKTIVCLLIGITLIWYFHNKPKLSLTLQTVTKIAVAGLFIAYIFGTHFIIVEKDQDFELLKGDYIAGPVLIETANYSIYPSQYWSLNEISFEAINQSFPWGLGPGKFNDYAHELKKNDAYPTHVPYPDPHSTYLGTLAEIGLLGLITFFGIIFFVIKFSRKILSNHAADQNMFTSLPTVFIVIGIEAISTDVMNFRHYWILLILLVSTFQNLKSTSSKSLNL